MVGIPAVDHRLPTDDQGRCRIRLHGRLFARIQRQTHGRSLSLNRAMNQLLKTDALINLTMQRGCNISWLVILARSAIGSLWSRSVS